MKPPSPLLARPMLAAFLNPLLRLRIQSFAKLKHKLRTTAKKTTIRLFSLSFLSAILLLPSCSTTKVTSEAADVLIVENLSARDPLSGTWRIEGAAQGTRTKAEDLLSVSTSGLAWGRVSQEQINPRRDLQGFIDRSEPNQVRFEVRQRGPGRWNEWTFNGLHPVDGSTETPETQASSQNLDLQLNESESEASGHWWNPRAWKMPSLPMPSLPKLSLPSINLWPWGKEES